MMIYAKEITFDILVGVYTYFSISVSRIKYMINFFSDGNFLLERKKTTTKNLLAMV